MTTSELKELVQVIVKEAYQLNIAHTDQIDVPVNYACIFTQSITEYEIMLATAQKLGSIVQETAMGPVLNITPLPTCAGTLRFLKIRRPDTKRVERGDADFTIADYESFKKSHIGKPNWDIIVRPEMEMLELKDPTFNVLAYYSYPTLAETLKLEFKNEK